MSGQVGIRITCATCGKQKAPVGRSAPMALYGAFCDWECPGYDHEPKVGDLWPGETCEQFGYAHSHNGTVPQ